MLAIHFDPRLLRRERGARDMIGVERGEDARNRLSVPRSSTSSRHEASTTSSALVCTAPASNTPV